MPATTDPVIVALVCSAGGLHALTTILADLPHDLPAAVIVLQHQSPYHPNPLPQLLEKRSLIPVSLGSDGDVLRPGQALVIPPGVHALVTNDNTLALISADGPPPYRPSADLLLASLALVAPRRSVAVILSGGGSDGATGATALHHLGGMVIASDRASSEHFAMPEAAILRDEVVDYVLPLGDIATRLAELVVALQPRSDTPDPADPLPADPESVETVS